MKIQLKPGTKVEVVSRGAEGLARGRERERRAQHASGRSHQIAHRIQPPIPAPSCSYGWRTQPEAIEAIIERVLSAPDLVTGLEGFAWSSDKVS